MMAQKIWPGWIITGVLKYVKLRDPGLVAPRTSANFLPVVGKRLRESPVYHKVHILDVNAHSKSDCAYENPEIACMCERIEDLIAHVGCEASMELSYNAVVERFVPRINPGSITE